MPSRTKGGPLTCLIQQDIIMAACLCSSQFPLRAPVIICNILVFFYKQVIPCGLGYYMSGNEVTNKLPNPKVQNCKCKILIVNLLGWGVLL